MTIDQLHQTLHLGGAIVMDGAMGTELGKLNEQGIQLGQESWSAAPLETRQGQRAIVGVHVASILAGAQIITTNTFRTQRLENSTDATLVACDLAIEARETTGRQALIAGSIGPVGDCYTPGDTPDDMTLWAAHSAQAKLLEQGGVDLIQIETIPTAREAIIAAQAVAESHLPLLLNLYCDPRDGSRLLPYQHEPTNGSAGHGEHIAQVLDTIRQLGIKVTAFGVNCVNTEPALQAVSSLSQFGGEIPISVYAQGDDASSPLRSERITDYYQAYMQFVERCLQAGVRLVGGCCGVPPDWVATISNKVAEHNQTVPALARN